MRWPHPYRMPKWILSAAAMGMLAAPSAAFAQTSAATGKPTVVKPATRQTVKPAQRTAPTVPPADESPAAPQDLVEGETPVQRELRRLYNENGREAPEVPTPDQMQRINGKSTGAPANAPLPPYGSSAAVPVRTNAAAPAASAPTRSSTSRNPVVSFFQRMMPGSKPATRTAPPAPITRPTTPAPTVAGKTPPAAHNYAPYNGTQPKRLPEQSAQPAAVASTPKSTSTAVVPPAPANVAERLQLDQVVATSAPQMVTPRVTTLAPTNGPVITGPSAAQAFTARTVAEPEPIFESPVIVGADAPSESPFEAPVVTQPQAEMSVAANEAPASREEFPDPFTAESEAKADEEGMESPFSGLALDEEEPLVAKPIPLEAAPELETPAEPSPLAIPQVTATATPAPAATAIEPEDVPAEVVTTPTGSLPAGEDAEFFPADVAQPAAVAKPIEVAKPAEVTKPIAVAKPVEEPVLTLPNEPIIAKPTTQTPEAAEYAAKMQKIRERGGMKGLKGFCPVMLRDERELQDAKPDFHSQFRGQKFHFASAEAKAKFDQAPAGYAPAAYGADVVVLIRDKDVAEGTLDFAAWYKGQLYLFSSEETHTAFTNDPAKFATPAGIE